MNPLLPTARFEAAAVVRASQSSFVPAFRVLPAGRRRDLETFYAFCRTADDIADLEGPAAAERYAALEAWRHGFRDAEMRGLPHHLCELIRRHALERSLFLELLDGVATDLASPVRMAARADLDLYCHRVAGTVGRLCLPIFGADSVRAGEYAETVGRALQYTNILRDTASDLRRGRIYYPLDELASAGVTDFPRGAEAYLVNFARQTDKLFDKAASMAPAEDARALRPARIMASIYRALLRKMQSDGLRVTEKRYRLSKPERLWAIIRAFAEL